MINATSGTSAVVGANGEAFRLSRNELCDLTFVPVHSSAVVNSLWDLTNERDSAVAASLWR